MAVYTVCSTVTAVRFSSNSVIFPDELCQCLCSHHKYEGCYLRELTAEP